MTCARLGYRIKPYLGIRFVIREENRFSLVESVPEYVGILALAQRQIRTFVLASLCSNVWTLRAQSKFFLSLSYRHGFPLAFKPISKEITPRFSILDHESVSVHATENLFEKIYHSRVYEGPNGLMCGLDAE
jgi:hypothetical protein